MIVVDTSAIVAIFREEPEAESFARVIAADDAPHISAASVLECSIVIRSLKELTSSRAERWIDEFLLSGQIKIIPVGLDDLSGAREAHIRFGKGTGHPAQLNFGDCFAYALAKSLNAPLLYKGNDFTRTDIASAS